MNMRTNYGAVVITLCVAAFFTSCEVVTGFMEDVEGGGGTGAGGAGSATIDPHQNLGRGYNVFGNYADTREVRAAVLDYGALNSAGYIDVRDVESTAYVKFTGNSISEYSDSMASSVGVSGGIKAFSGSVRTNFSTTTTQRAEYSFATVQSQIYKSEATIAVTQSSDLKRYLTPRAATDINNSFLSPEDLFTIYGTHVIRGLYAGGRVDYSRAADMTQVTTSRSLSVMVSASFDALFGTLSADGEYVSDQDRSHFEANSEQRLNVYGGASELALDIANKDQYDAWIASVDANRHFVGFPQTNQSVAGALIPLWEFADDPVRASELQNAFNTLADGQDLPNDNKVTVEITLVDIYLVSEDDAGGEEELFGTLGAEGRTGGGLEFGPNAIWDISADDADAYGTVSPGQTIPIHRTIRGTFNNFDESTSYVRIWGFLKEEDTGGDDDLGFDGKDIYIRDGWNGSTLFLLYFRNGGTQARVAYRVKVVR